MISDSFVNRYHRLSVMGINFLLFLFATELQSVDQFPDISLPLKRFHK
jgi:hypothetical protein